MKKIFIIIIMLSLILIIAKYYFSNYEIQYKLNNYNIYTKYKNKRFYFEISNNDIIYNFDIYANRTLNKTKIKDIKKISIEGYNCIYPIIEKMNTYPLCYDINFGELVDFNLIDDDALEEYKETTASVDKPNKDFVYYNNLGKNDYVALWNYKGFTIMNDSKYNIINIFNKDRYDNNLSYIINENIYMPNYDEQYEFKKIISLNIVTQKINYIDLNYTIDYDSYIVGNIKNKLYIFDNKNDILYEINSKNGKTTILSNNAKGYVKYYNGKFISCSKSEYKVDKITFINNNSLYNYEFNNGTYKMIKDNDKIKTKINNDNILKVYEKNNNLYYVLNDSFYIYNPLTGNNKVFYDYELSFNNTKSVFMYSK